MKKIVLLLCVLLLFVSLHAYAIRLGAQILNWNGMIQGQFYQGVLIQQTAPGFPAWNTLFPGDIITEGIMIPNSWIWSQPGNPQQGMIFSFTPFNPLNQQLWNLQQYNLPYNYQMNLRENTLLQMIQTAPYNSNVVFRVYRPQWNSWTLISVVLDSAGQGSIWIPPQPGPQPPSGQVIVTPPGPGQVVVQPPQAHVAIQLWIRF